MDEEKSCTNAQEGKVDYSDIKCESLLSQGSEGIDLNKVNNEVNMEASDAVLEDQITEKKRLPASSESMDVHTDHFCSSSKDLIVKGIIDMDQNLVIGDSIEKNACQDSLLLHINEDIPKSVAKLPENLLNSSISQAKMHTKDLVSVDVEENNKSIMDGEDSNFCDMSDLAFITNFVLENQVQNEPEAHKDTSLFSTDDELMSKASKVLGRQLVPYDSNSSETEDSDSDSESSSSSSSSDSTSSMSADGIELTKIQQSLEEAENHAENDDEFLQSVPKTKDEILPQELPEEPEIEAELPEGARLDPIGEIQSFVELMLVIKGLKDAPALDTDTTFFKNDRKAFGRVFDVFGPVESPFYVVRFASEDKFGELGLAIGDTAYFAPNYLNFTNYVFLEQLKKMKGSDASWQHDQEPPAECLDYSDDEQESKAKSASRKKRQNERMRIKNGDDNDADCEDIGNRASTQKGKKWKNGNFKKGNKQDQHGEKPLNQQMNMSSNECNSLFGNRSQSYPPPQMPVQGENKMYLEGSNRPSSFRGPTPGCFPRRPDLNGAFIRGPRPEGPWPREPFQGGPTPGPYCPGRETFTGHTSRGPFPGEYMQTGEFPRLGMPRGRIPGMQMTRGPVLREHLPGQGPTSRVTNNTIRPGELSWGRQDADLHCLGNDLPEGQISDPYSESRKASSLSEQSDNRKVISPDVQSANQRFGYRFPPPSIPEMPRFDPNIPPPMFPAMFPPNMPPPGFPGNRPPPPGFHRNLPSPNWKPPA